MWGAIKKALNSTLGTKQFSALDILAKKNTYNYFYNEWFGKDSTYSSAPKIYQITNEKKLNLEVGDSGRSLVVLPPEVEEIDQPLGDSYYRLPTCFLPYGIKNVNCSIEFNLDYGFLCYFPETIEHISENAFVSLKSMDKIVINKKKDDLAGHPWGHPAGDDGIIYIG